MSHWIGTSPKQNLTFHKSYFIRPVGACFKQTGLHDTGFMKNNHATSSMLLQGLQPKLSAPGIVHDTPTQTYPCRFVTVCAGGLLCSLQVVFHVGSYLRFVLNDGG